ncbi:Poly [ADP-ribose] polymerase 3 [Portunus trituberculatus]|uniref:Poly [ADP-ribose] polymerase 3 n=1 Tax=Portunus trituberculatus TaxID=210409 RepID=A0A5B7G4C7_PORTR|nr:Poly [ADP-ribose] polymerase 3 [Portunus trituberculatus]
MKNKPSNVNNQWKEEAADTWQNDNYSHEEEVPEKLQREDSATTQLRNAINETKATASKEKKKGNFKADGVLLLEFPKAAIYEDYTCMLNQTNIGHNNNKFYIIQVTENKKNSFTCFTRWGRVGEEGQHNLDNHKDVEQAIKAFKKKFKDKTKNDWDKRDNFTAHPGKYTMIDIEEDDEEEEADAVDGGKQLAKKSAFSGDCSLNYRTQLMIMIIFSEDMFTKQMSIMNLDIKKMPLGKLSKVQIAKGLEVLLDIEAAIKNNEPRHVLMDLSSKFYTHCPHDFGRMVPPVLDTDSIIQQKKEVMMTLGDIELTQSLQKDKVCCRLVHREC